MSEGPFPKTIQEAIPWVTWGAVVFTFFLVFVEKLVESAYGQALSALIGGGIVTAVALHSKTWLQKTNPNLVFAAALALLFAIISAPWVEQKRWPFSAWFYDSNIVELQNSTLIEWLQQAQRNRDEAKQLAAEAETQKATLVEWLQNAQHERDDVRQELQRQRKPSPLQGPAMMTFLLPGETPKGDTTAQECINLAHSLANLNPNKGPDKSQIEHLRATMTALGCGCDAVKQ
jgi:hypothetical protein